MNAVLSKVDISLVARQYVANGWVLVPIPSGSKAPKSKGWNRPENGIRSAAACARIRDNVGIAHKYSRTCVLDFDDIEKSAAWLESQGLDFDDLWNAPNAVRISSGRPNRGKLLFRLPPGVNLLHTHPLHEFGIELRCASSNGMTVQDVLPPSIHPDTGMPYEWEYAEPVLGHWKYPPTLPADVLAVWQGLTSETADIPANPGHGDEEAARAVLAEFNPDIEYHGWIEIGMALHHEFDGGYEGLELWDEWSADGAEYKGIDDLGYHWRTFTADRDGATSTLDSLRAKIRNRPTSPEEFDALIEQHIAAETVPAKTGTAGDDFTVLDEPVASRDLSPIPKRKPFELMSAAQFMGRPPLQWVVKGVLPKAAIGVIYGSSDAGKTFMALDMALSIARGLDWRGLRTKKGGVAYVVAEGATGFQSRLQAYCQANGLAPGDLPMHLMDDAPNISSAKAMAPVCAELLKCGPLSVIFMDTYARVLGDGDENSAKDTALAVANCYHLHRQTGAIVILVHHTGKDGAKGARGSGALRAAADVELEVIRTAKYRALRIGKMKDGPDEGEFKFNLLPVAIGWDEDGDEVTSCVVEHLTNTPTSTEASVPDRYTPCKDKAPVQVLVLDVLNESLGGAIPRDALESEVRERMERDSATGQEDKNWKLKITRALAKLEKELIIREILGNIEINSEPCE